MMKTTVIQLLASDISRQSGRDGMNLIMRSAGREFLVYLQKHLEHLSPMESMILSFAGIELMDASFADEVFGTLAVARSRKEDHRPRCLLLESLDETSQDNLMMALTSRPKREASHDGGTLRNCVIPVITGNDIELVGKTENHVEETFALLRRTKQLATSDVISAFNMSITAASTRLKILYDLGLALRQELRDDQGIQYLYFWPV